MSRANRLRMLSFAGTAVLVAACGNGAGGGMQDSPSKRRRKWIPLRQDVDGASRRPPASLSIELTGDCEARPDPSTCGSRWTHRRSPRSRPSWPARRVSRKRSSSRSQARTSLPYAEPLAKYRSQIADQQSKMADQSRQRRRRRAGPRPGRPQRHRRARGRVAARPARPASGRGQGAAGPRLPHDPHRDRSVRRRRDRAGDRTRCKGVMVAALGSGIDYTHRNLGGEGTLAAYAAAYGAAPGDPLKTTLDGLFPDCEGHRRLRLRRRSLAERPAHRRSGSDRLPGPRLARR